jgi:transcriptional regulator with XRE-family HTH domain
MKHPATPSIIGQNVSRLRRRLGLTQAQLATRARLSHSIISRLETGQIKGINSERIHPLAEVLGVDCNALLAPYDGNREQGDALARVIRRIRAQAFAEPDLGKMLTTVGHQLVANGVFRGITLGVVKEDNLEIVTGFRNLNSADDLESGQQVDGDPAGLRAVRTIPLDDPDDLSVQAVRQKGMLVLEGFGMKVRATQEEALSREGEWEAGDKVAYFVPIQWGGEVVGVMMVGSTIEMKEEILNRLATLEPLIADIGLAIALLTHKRIIEDSAQKLRSIEEDIHATIRRIRHVEDLEVFVAVLRRGLGRIFEEVVGVGVILINERTDELVNVTCYEEEESRMRRNRELHRIDSPDGLGLIDHWRQGEVFFRGGDQLKALLRQNRDRSMRRRFESASYLIDVPFGFGTLSAALSHSNRADEIIAFLKQLGRWLDYALQPIWREYHWERHCTQACEKMFPSIENALQAMRRLEDLTQVLPVIYGYLDKNFHSVRAVNIHIIQETAGRCRAFSLKPGQAPEGSEWQSLRALGWAEGEDFINHWRTDQVFDRLAVDGMFSRESPFSSRREWEDNESERPVWLIDVPFSVGMLGVGLSTPDNGGTFHTLQLAARALGLGLQRFFQDNAR